MKLVLKVCPPIQSESFNALLASAWPGYVPPDVQRILKSALVYVCAYENERLVGFAKIVGDGSSHGFLLDPTVAPDQRRKGIGRRIVALCTDEARRRGVEWLHVDFEPSLKPFYMACGFRHTEAGLLNLKNSEPHSPVQATPAKSVIEEPKCIIISGRPGSGKTTLAGDLSRKLYLPKLSRDEFKEGYVNTFKVKHDQLPEDTNGKVNDLFFETILNLLKGNISIVIEAAFQHKLWCLIVPRIQKIAQPLIVICDLDAEASAKRHLDRGLKDPKREFFHGDRRVSLYRETGQFLPGGDYDAPHFDVPTLRVSTCDGYVPGIEGILDFIEEMPKPLERLS